MVDWRHWRLTTRRPLLYSHYLRRYRQIHPFGLKQARKATLLTTLRTLVNKVIPWWFLPNAYRLIDITELPPLSIYLLSCLIESCGLCFLPPSSSLLSIRALPEDSGQAFPVTPNWLPKHLCFQGVSTVLVCGDEKRTRTFSGLLATHTFPRFPGISPKYSFGKTYIIFGTFGFSDIFVPRTPHPQHFETSLGTLFSSIWRSQSIDPHSIYF